MEKSKNRNPNTEELEKGFRTAFIDGEYNSNLAYRPEFLSNNAAECCPRLRANFFGATNSPSAWRSLPTAELSLLCKRSRN